MLLNTINSNFGTDLHLPYPVKNILQYVTIFVRSKIKVALTVPYEQHLLSGR